MLSNISTKLIALVVFMTAALFAFAGNSLLCRFALLERAIDPLSFTAIRLGSGALALAPLVWRSRSKRGWNPRGAACLFAYALCFSLAYVSLDTGTGALVPPVTAAIFQGSDPFYRVERVGDIGVVAGVCTVSGSGKSMKCKEPKELN